MAVKHWTKDFKAPELASGASETEQKSGQRANTRNRIAQNMREEPVYYKPGSQNPRSIPDTPSKKKKGH